MVANPYNLNSQLGYKEILHLVRQLSDSDKEKLVKDISVDVSPKEIEPLEETGENTLAYLKKMAERVGKRSRSIGTVLNRRTGNALGKEFKIDVSKLNIVSVDDVKNGNYQNKMNKDEVVGKWPGDESVEELLNMLTK